LDRRKEVWELLEYIKRLVAPPPQPATSLERGYERRGAGAAAPPLHRVRRGQLGADQERRVPHHLHGAAGAHGGGGPDI